MVAVGIFLASTLGKVLVYIVVYHNFGQRWAYICLALMAVLALMEFVQLFRQLSKKK